MASIGICASIERAHSSQCVIKKQPPPLARSTRARARASSLGTEREKHVLTSNFEGHKHLTTSIQNQKEENPLKDEKQHLKAPNFFDGRWKNGTWDLNMFVKQGKIDWHSVIFAEARRRRFLELYPEAATKQEPVVFRSSIIPWWAWITHSHLPQAELLNGRAAMVGFFMSYLVDALTRIDVVGQTGNFVCKFALFITVIGVVLFRRKDDFDNLQKLAAEATFYDKQWQSSWQDQNAD